MRCPGTAPGEDCDILWTESFDEQEQEYLIGMFNFFDMWESMMIDWHSKEDDMHMHIDNIQLLKDKMIKEEL